MKDKWRDKLNVLVNVLLAIAIVGVTYSWMITAPSEGELVDYDRDLIIASSDITVDVYAYIDGVYVEQLTSPMTFGLLAPGVEQKFRFDITNENNNLAATKIVFSNITGDINDIKNYLIIGSTSPDIYTYTLTSRLLQSTEDYTYYFNFLDEVLVPANSTISLYWYATVDEDATVTIGDKGITVEHIVFIEP